MINPAYSTNLISDVTITVVNSGKKKKNHVFKVNRNIAPCTAFTHLVSQANSAYGGENNVKFTISFITGHFIPTDGALAIEFPEAYTINLLDPNCNVACKVMKNKQDTKFKCIIGSPSRIDI